MTDHSPAQPSGAPVPLRPRPVDWNGAVWLNPPAAVTRLGDTVIVTTMPDSDFWRTTSYGFLHDNGHCLLTDFPPGSAVEVSFVAEFAALDPDARATAGPACCSPGGKALTVCFTGFVAGPADESLH